MAWSRSLFSDQKPRLLTLLREMRDGLPPEKPPTAAEARRIEPLIPLWASGVIPLDPVSQAQAKRWMQYKRQEFSRAGRQAALQSEETNAVPGVGPEGWGGRP